MDECMGLPGIALPRGGVGAKTDPPSAFSIEVLSSPSSRLYRTPWPLPRLRRYRILSETLDEASKLGSD